MSKNSKSGGPHHDVSLLRPSISLGMGGVKQILHTMKVGTEEMKDALLHQCDIIFECKVCRSMFRGLPNLIAHKRVYCQEMLPSYEEGRLEQLVEDKPEDETVILQPEQPKEAKKSAEWDNFVETDEEESNEKEGEHSVVDQMLKGEFVGKSEEYKFYTKAVEREGRKRQRKREMTVKLECVPGISTAMVQSCHGLGYGEVNENVIVVEPKEPKGRGRPKKRKRMEVGQDEDSRSEKSFKQEDDIVVVEPKEATGPIHMNLRQRSSSSGNNNGGTLVDQLKKRPDCDVSRLECLKCKCIYSSAKTLHFHMLSQHSEKRTFYPCIKCSAVFAQMWGVTRHLTTSHGLSRQTVRGMTSDIRKGAFEKSMLEIWELDLPKLASAAAGVGNAASSSTATSALSAATHQKNDKKDGRSKGEESTAGEQLGLNFIMHRCKGCMKIFGKKDTHDRHARMCHMVKKVGEGSNSSGVSSTSSNQQHSRNASTVVTSLDSRSSMQQQQQPSSSSSSSSQGSGTEISAIEMQQIQAIIDENSQQCLKCYRMFGSVSNLHRHAIRHLGWRRFKCKFCRFLCYNRSECRRHLRVVHHKSVNCKAAHLIDRFIDSVEPQSVLDGGQQIGDGGGGGGKGRLPRVNMQTSFMSKKSSSTSDANNVSTSRLDNTIRTRAGVYQKNAHKPETVLVTRSGTYRKPTFAQLTKSRGNDSDDNDDSGSATSVDSMSTSNPAEVQEDKKLTPASPHELDEEEEIEMKKDLTDSRNRRKSQNPNKGTESPSKHVSNTPATAKPASHILQSPAKTPTKQPMPGSNPGTPNGSGKANGHGNKTPTVNILSKSSSLPKFSISGGVTTVRLPVFTQCIQIQSSMRGGNGNGNIRLIHQPTNILPKPESSAQGPQVRILGPNFQLPGSTGGAQVRTIAVSSLPTTGNKNTYTITGANVQGMPLLQPVQPLSAGAAVAGTSGSAEGASGSSNNHPPELKPSDVVTSPSVTLSTSVSDIRVMTGVCSAVRTAECQLSPAMPNLDPISSTSTSSAITGSAAGRDIVVSEKSSSLPTPNIDSVLNVAPTAAGSSKVGSTQGISVPVNVIPVSVLPQSSSNIILSSSQSTDGQFVATSSNVVVMNSLPMNTIGKNVIILKSNAFSRHGSCGNRSNVGNMIIGNSLANLTGSTMSVLNSSPIMTVRKVVSSSPQPSHQQRSLTPQPTSAKKVILDGRSRSFTPSPTTSAFGVKKDVISTDVLLGLSDLAKDAGCGINLENALDEGEKNEELASDINLTSTQTFNLNENDGNAIIVQDFMEGDITEEIAQPQGGDKIECQASSSMSLMDGSGSHNSDPCIISQTPALLQNEASVLVENALANITCANDRSGGAAKQSETLQGDPNDDDIIQQSNLPLSSEVGGFELEVDDSLKMHSFVASSSEALTVCATSAVPAAVVAAADDDINVPDSSSQFVVQEQMSLNSLMIPLVTSSTHSGREGVNENAAAAAADVINDGESGLQDGLMEIMNDESNSNNDPMQYINKDSAIS